MAPKGDPNAIVDVFVRVLGGEVGAASSLAPKIDTCPRQRPVSRSGRASRGLRLRLGCAAAGPRAALRCAALRRLGPRFAAVCLVCCCCASFA